MLSILGSSNFEHLVKLEYIEGIQTLKILPSGSSIDGTERTIASRGCIGLFSSLVSDSFSTLMAQISGTTSLTAVTLSFDGALVGVAVP